MAIASRDIHHVERDRLRLEALAGAFRDGVDLGSGGPDIRQLGQSLEGAIAALRAELIGIGVTEMIDRF